MPTDEEAAFAAIKAGVDLLPPGAKMFLNSGRLCLFVNGTPLRSY